MLTGCCPNIFETEGHKEHEDGFFERELTKETEDNLTRFLTSAWESFASVAAFSSC
jgi:heme-degrading monooxygenase HmoA